MAEFSLGTARIVDSTSPFGEGVDFGQVGEHNQDSADSQPVALDLIRRLRGRSEAILVSASDARSYAVKLAGNPEGTRSLANEWIGSRILAQFGIATPPVATVSVNQDFVDRHFPGGFRGSKTRPLAGIHFGSRSLSNDKLASYDLLPRSLMQMLTNRQDCLGVLVVDTWLGNTDGRQAVFCRERGGHAKAFTAQMIDHGRIFDGSNWLLHQADKLGRGISFYALYAQIRRLTEFEPWIEAVSTFPDALVNEAFDSVPLSWRGPDQAAFDHLRLQLLRRRTFVADLVAAYCESNANLFGSWDSTTYLQ